MSAVLTGRWSAGTWGRGSVAPTVETKVVMTETCSADAMVGRKVPPWADGRAGKTVGRKAHGRAGRTDVRSAGSSVRMTAVLTGSI
jgi:hypothetical protein